MLRHGQLNATLGLPQMDLPFLVTLARPTRSNTGGIDPKATWVFFNEPLRCDAFPLSDEMLFAQSGTQNIATIVFHFYYNQDVRVRDRVQLQFIDSVVGDPGAWYEIQHLERPHDVLSYLRAHGRVSDAPPS